MRAPTIYRVGMPAAEGARGKRWCGERV